MPKLKTNPRAYLEVSYQPARMRGEEQLEESYWKPELIIRLDGFSDVSFRVYINYTMEWITTGISTGIYHPTIENVLKGCKIFRKIPTMPFSDAYDSKKIIIFYADALQRLGFIVATDDVIEAAARMEYAIEHAGRKVNA